MSVFTLSFSHWKYCGCVAQTYICIQLTSLKMDFIEIMDHELFNTIYNLSSFEIPNILGLYHFFVKIENIIYHSE